MSHLGSLDRIEQVATSTLGMRVPSERDIVMVKRIPRIGPNGYQDDEVIPKVWVAEGKSPHVAGMLW
ncbi:MAG: cell division protein FtsL [Desulfobacterales bacterium]|nr:cell division protein FtsL [Desulfobacterales bacterium]